MPGQGHEGRDLVQLGGMDIRQRVLLPVEHTRLQRRRQFRPCQRCGGRAEGLEDVQRHLIRRGADLHARQIGRFGHMFGQMGDIADAIVPEAEDLQARVLRAGIQQITHLAVQHRPCGGQVGKEERQTQQTDLGHDLAHRALAVGRHLNDPRRGRGQHFHIIAHRGRGGQIDRVARTGGKQLGPFLGRDIAGVSGIFAMRKDHFGMGGPGKQGRRGQNGHQSGLHGGFLPW